MQSPSTSTSEPNPNGWAARFASAHPAVCQFIKFALLGLIASAVEFLVFALCNFCLFRSLAQRPFSWRLIDYSVANGGLCAFWSFVISYAAGQTANFFVQRRYTFHARTNAASSGALYALVIAAVYFYTLWLPTVLRAPFAAALGTALGDLCVKAVNMFTSMLILFPINKFVIMRDRPSKPDRPDDAGRDR